MTPVRFGPFAPGLTPKLSDVFLSKYFALHLLTLIVIPVQNSVGISTISTEALGEKLMILDSISLRDDSSEISYHLHHQYDVLIWLNATENLTANWIQKLSKSNVENKTDISNTLTISIHNLANFTNTTNVFMIQNDQCPMIALFLFFDEAELVRLSRQLGNPIINFFVHPKLFSSKEQAETESKSLLELIGHNLSIASNTYLVVYYYENSSTISYAILESYTIRNTTIIHECPGSGSGLLRNVEPQQNVTIETFSISDPTFYNVVPRRINFEQATVIGTGLNDPEFNLSTKFKESTDKFDSGFDVDVYRYLRDALNFTEKSIKGSGYIKEGAPNGPLNGYAGQTSTGEADIGIGATEFILYRLKGPDAIAYLFSTTRTSQNAYFKQPPPSTVRNIFIKTFTFKLWLSLLGIWIVIVLALRAVVRIQQYLNISNESDQQISKDAVIWATGAICQQGWHTSPNSICVKIVFLFGSLTGLILYIAYAAALVSILSVNVDPVEEFNDLVSQGFSIVNDYRIPTTNLTLRGLEADGKIPKANYERNVVIERSVADLISNAFAIVSTPDSFYPILTAHNYSDTFICKTIERVMLTTPIIKMSPFTKKGSPLRSYFNLILLQMQERGIVSRLFQAYMKESCVQCLEKRTIHHDNLDLGDVFTAFAILIAGYGVSFAIALGEKVWFWILRAELYTDEQD